VADGADVDVRLGAVVGAGGGKPAPLLMLLQRLLLLLLPLDQGGREAVVLVVWCYVGPV
jgi:hypothetical protein